MVARSSLAIEIHIVIRGGGGRYLGALGPVIYIRGRAGYLGLARRRGAAADGGG
jgi:hypothetical protein